MQAVSAGITLVVAVVVLMCYAGYVDLFPTFIAKLVAVFIHMLGTFALASHKGKDQRQDRNCGYK